LSATAGATAGAVGTYAFLNDITNSNTSLAAGTTIAGSSLRYAGMAVANSCDTGNYVDIFSGTPSGTWRLMGYGQRVVGNFPDKYATLFLRIS
jgi:hypothetical protein